MDRLSRRVVDFTALLLGIREQGIALAIATMPELGSSAGETHQRILPKARIVKVFNTVGHALFFRPKLQAGLRGDMFLCGDDAEAKRRTADLVREFGWEPVDVGGIDASHYLEATCMVWVWAGNATARSASVARAVLCMFDPLMFV